MSSAPWPTRASTSRPRASVPNGCAQEGDWSRAVVSRAQRVAGAGPSATTASSRPPYSRGRVGGPGRRRAVQRGQRAVAQGRADQQPRREPGEASPATAAAAGRGRGCRPGGRAGPAPPRPGGSVVPARGCRRPARRRPRRRSVRRRTGRSSGSSPGTQRRRAWRAMLRPGHSARGGGQRPLLGERAGQQVVEQPAEQRARRAGRAASAGSTIHWGPYQPSAGSQPSCTPTTVASTEAVEEVGQRGRGRAEPVPADAPAVEPPPRAEPQGTGAHRARR